MITDSNEWYENSFKQVKRTQKLKSDTELLNYYVEQMNEQYLRWAHIYNNGSNDPCWPDGINLNLVRNHIIYYKKNIEKLCELRSLPVPKEIKYATPPEIDHNYNTKAKNKTEETNQKPVAQFEQLTFAF